MGSCKCKRFQTVLKVNGTRLQVRCRACGETRLTDSGKAIMARVAVADERAEG